jgi:kynureninase
MDDLLSYRSEFPILESTTYMISHSLGAMPRKVYDNLRDYADMWASRGILSWAEGWWEKPVTTGNLIATLIGAQSGEVVMHQNVSVAVSIILSAVDFSGGRNEILYFDLDFPTVIYVLEAQKRRGARVTPIKSADLTVPVNAMMDAISERTAVVCFSHVFFRTSEQIDVQPLVKRAHDMGALALVDVYQSAGAVPVDVKAWNADFVVGGSVKWLCGGPGAGYLYVKPSLYSRLEPMITGWMAHAHPFAFETGPIQYAENSTRFLHGSPQVPALYAAEPGYEIVSEIGLQKIRAKSLRQTDLLFDLCKREGFRIQTPQSAERRGGTVVVDVPNGDAIVKELSARKILVDYRPGAGIRISPHFYTTDEEIRVTFDAIVEILKTKAYEKHMAQRGSLY